jgi:hypothetical protein
MIRILAAVAAARRVRAGEHAAGDRRARAAFVKEQVEVWPRVVAEVGIKPE